MFSQFSKSERHLKMFEVFRSTIFQNFWFLVCYNKKFVQKSSNKNYIAHYFSFFLRKSEQKNLFTNELDH